MIKSKMDECANAQKSQKSDHLCSGGEDCTEEFALEMGLEG